MKLVQWNIGGAQIRELEADPTDVASYNRDGLEYVGMALADIKPDIVTLQETHESEGYNQAQLLAEMAGLKYWVNDTHGRSHIDRNHKFGQAILSRFPILDYTFSSLPNPRLRTVGKSGVPIYSHNYGITRTELESSDGLMQVQTLHAPPLHFFDAAPDSPAAMRVLATIEGFIDKPRLPTVIPADYNLNVDSILNLMPGLAEKGFYEVVTAEATTPKGKRLDRILCQGIGSVTVRALDDALTDHYPLVAEIQLHDED